MILGFPYWRVLAFVLATGLTTAGSTLQSAPTNLQIAPLEVPELSFVPLDSPRLAPGIVDVLEEKGAALTGLAPYVLVLSNRSSRQIKAVTASWRITDTAGNATTTYHSAMLFTSPYRAAVGAMSQALFTPTGFADVFSLSKGIYFPPIPSSTEIRELRRARNVVFEIDTVVFEDGQVWGPDHSRTVENIQNWRTAITALAVGGREAAARGIGLGDFLNFYATKALWSPRQEIPQGSLSLWQFQLNAASKQEDFFGFWMAENARVILNAPTSAQFLSSLASGPALPTFFRESR
jgi:hypothetical protein